jgi:hypothetical protein
MISCAELGGRSVRVEIKRRSEPKRIFAEEPPDVLVVVSGAVVVEAGFRVRFARRLLEWIHHRGRRLAGGVVRIGVHNRAGCSAR